MCPSCLLTTWKCVPLVDLLNSPAGRNSLSPTPILGCSSYAFQSPFSFHLGCSHARKTTTNKTKQTSLQLKTAHVGMQPSKINQTSRNNTTMLLHHLYILCHFTNHAPHKTLCTQPISANQQPTLSPTTS